MPPLPQVKPTDETIPWFGGAIELDEEMAEGETVDLSTQMQIDDHDGCFLTAEETQSILAVSALGCHVEAKTGCRDR